jgi:CheY-like chemotaxis protein
VRQILLNIIGNAVKFSNDGEIRISLKTAVQGGEEKMCFTIKDNGPGIDEKYMSSIFKPFSQGDSSTSRKYGGTGLGLALSRKLARSLGGDVELLNSKMGEGSTFMVSLATQMRDETVTMITELDQDEAQKQQKAAKNKMKIEKVLQGINVLVAEDAIENQKLLTWFLEKAGASVDLAQNGREAIERALSGHHDLVLMDIQMPEVDGYEATKTLRQKGFTTPIVAVTAHALVEERQRCLEAGCTDHLSKPIDVHQLIDKVTRYHQGPRH